MLGLLYFGRLEKEKGVDGIIDMIDIFAKKGKLSFEIFIFGSGSLENKILELANQHKEVHFFGRKSLNEIKKYVQNCQYCLMPSTFLETFGLTALTALSRGLPVIGYKKGGLIPFVDEELNLYKYGDSLGEQLYKLISLIVGGQQTHRVSKDVKYYVPTIDHYSIDTRKKNIQILLGNKKKILLVSDFISKVGGIETYIYDVKEILESEGYEIELFGTSLCKGPRGAIKKLLGIALGLGNIGAAIQLYRKAKQFKPDIIWYNSTLRWLGWMPIWVSKFLPVTMRMMYHDLGYFAPFPSSITEENQVKTPLTLKHFLASGENISLRKKPFIIGKYLTIKALSCVLKKHIDLHLVPSGFLKDMLHKSYKISKEKIVVLEHFLQE